MAFSTGGSVRIAAADPAGHDLPAVLGIELLGGRAQLVPGIAADESLRAAYAGNAVDAVLLRGESAARLAPRTAPAHLYVIEISASKDPE